MVKINDEPTAAALRAQRLAARSAANAKKPAEQSAASDWPAEGPHARGDLINEDATPGSGLFSSDARKDGKKVDPGAG